MPDPQTGLSPRQRVLKRSFDVIVGSAALIATSPLAITGVVLAKRDTGASGVFAQERIGRSGRPFQLYKVRTMRPSTTVTTTVTTKGDARITPLGGWLRTLKIDELPQLVNVVRGEMSLVGPRPDVAGWADQLTGGDRIVLSVRPGITGPASLAFRHEEDLLEAQDDPHAYNREVIWPEKVRLNREYVENWSLRSDLRYLWLTVRSVSKSAQ